MKQALIARATAAFLFAMLGAVPMADAQFANTTPAAQTPPAAAAAERPFDVASRLYEQGKQAEALVTLRQLAEAGDARAQYLVGLDLLEGKYLPRDNPQGFAGVRYYRLSERGREFAERACGNWRSRPLLQRLAIRLAG